MGVHRESKQFLHFGIFVLPALFFVLLATDIPFILNMVYSLFEWNGVSKSATFVGLENFAKIFRDRLFWKSFLFTMRYTFFYVLIVNLLSLFVALQLWENTFSRKVGRTLYYVPYIISLTAISLVWQFILGPVFAGLYKLTGISFFHLSWLGRPKLTFIIILLMTIWQNIGFYMVNYIAGIITIPRELMEAAVIDGASSRQCFMKVMLPLMVPSLSICILLSMMFGLKLFDIIMVFTQGGPVNSTVSVAYNIFAKLIFILTLLFSLFWLMPLAFIFINSFKGDAEIVNRFLELPKEWSIRYYAETWNKFHFPLLLKNTIFYTVVTTAMVLLLAPMASYFIVRRKNMLLSKISFALLILPIMVPFQTYMISLTKFMGGFHLIGTKVGYIVVTVGLLMPLAVYIIYNYINTIPLTLEESAYIDGANLYQCYFYIILPLLRPVLTTVLVLDALSTWNDVITNQLIVGTKMSSINIQNALYMFFSVQSSDWSHALPGTMMSILPSLLFFLLMQKYIVTGITAGAVKG